MTTVGEVFVCRHCSEAITSDTGRPDKCPGCGKRLGNKDNNNRFRVGTNPFHQFVFLSNREVAKPAEATQLPEETDVQFTARKRAEIHARVAKLRKELSEFVMDIPVADALRAVEYAEYLVEHCVFFDLSTVKKLKDMSARMLAITTNVLEGRKLGVVYGNNTARGEASSEDQGNLG